MPGAPGGRVQSMMVSLLLLLGAVFYRVVLAWSGGADWGGWANFAPLGALALCGGRYLPRSMGLWVPLLALGVSDMVLNGWVYGLGLWSWELAPRYGALLLTGLLGRWMAVRGAASTSWMLGGSLAASAVFYLVTNTASWVLDAGYSKTAAGWLQALTTGLPGYPSTLSFYRNTLLSDLAFTLLFGFCMRWTTAPDTRPAPGVAAVRAGG